MYICKYLIYNIYGEHNVWSTTGPGSTKKQFRFHVEFNKNDAILVTVVSMVFWADIMVTMVNFH